MTSKHSPGPWSFQDHGSLILDARSGSSQTLVAKVEVNTYRDEGRYNAHLIAAAPELLEACQTFAEWLRREEAGSHGQPWAGKRGTPEGEAAWRAWWEENLRICNLAQEQVRAAITKAAGEA